MKFYFFLFLLFFAASACNEATKQVGAQKSFPKEIRQVSNQIEKTPTDAKLFFLRADLYRQIDEDSLAFLDLLKTVSLDSSQSNYFSAIGDFLFDKKDIAASVKWFKKAIDINPSDEISHLKMANLFLYTKDYPKAFAEINAVLRQNVYNAEAYFIKGLCYKDMGETDRAISSFQTAVQTEPAYYDGFIQLGILYAKKKDPLALQYFDNAIQLDSFNYEGHYAKGMFYQNQKKYEEAKKVFKNAIRIDKNYAEAHYNIGWMLLQQDSNAKAIREFDRVLSLDPDNARAYFNRGLNQEILGKFKEAKEDYEQALIFDPEFDLPTTALERVKKNL